MGGGGQRGARGCEGGCVNEDVVVVVDRENHCVITYLCYPTSTKEVRGRCREKDPLKGAEQE